MEKPIRVLVANRPRLARDRSHNFRRLADIEIIGQVASQSEIFKSVKKTAWVILLRQGSR